MRPRAVRARDVVSRARWAPTCPSPQATYPPAARRRTFWSAAGGQPRRRALAAYQSPAPDRSGVRESQGPAHAAERGPVGGGGDDLQGVLSRGRRRQRARVGALLPRVRQRTSATAVPPRTRRALTSRTSQSRPGCVGREQSMRTRARTGMGPPVRGGLAAPVSGFAPAGASTSRTSPCNSSTIPSPSTWRPGTSSRPLLARAAVPRPVAPGTAPLAHAANASSAARRDARAARETGRLTAPA